MLILSCRKTIYSTDTRENELLKSTYHIPRLINTFSHEIETNIDGSGNTIATNQLCGGAKINRIFHEKFPFELVKVINRFLKIGNTITPDSDDEQRYKWCAMNAK